MYPSVGARAGRVRRIRIVRACVVGLVLAAQVVVFGQATNPGAARAAPAVAQTYYTPYEAQQYIGILRTIADDPACCTSPVISTVSITSGANGNTVYYDHFEDGYEADPLNPVQASTLVLSMDAGDVWTQTSSVPVDVGGSRGAGNYFDGRDRISSTAPIAMTQTGYATELRAHCWPAGWRCSTSTSPALRFDIPAGENADYNQVFEFVGLVIVATADDTTVTLDLDANGSFESSFSLDEGETHLVNGGRRPGRRRRVGQARGGLREHRRRRRQLRGTDLRAVPDGDLVEPERQPGGARYSLALGTRVFLFNPGASAITVDVLTGGGGTSTVSLGARGQASYLMPVDDGARFTSQGGRPFFAFQMSTTEGSSTSAYDWGYTLIPAKRSPPR